MNADELLTEVRKAIDGKDPDAPAIRKRLTRIVNRVGAAELLAHVLRHGSLFEAHLAAIALPYARNELVRRGIRKEARSAVGERRAAFLAALTERELEQVLGENTLGLGEDLVQASGMLAANSPREFVDLLCEGQSIIDGRVVEHVDRVRRSFAIGAASMFSALLERRLTADARHKAVAILGREPGEAVRKLLDREQRRATTDEDKRFIRREKMRQASLALGPDELKGREGAALVSPLGPADAAALEIFEQLGPDRVLRSTVLIALGGFVDRMSTPEQGGFEAVMTKAEPALPWARMSLGQVRSMLEALPAKRREALAPLIDRLAPVPLEELTPPAPGPELGLRDAITLLHDPVWHDWRPLQRLLQNPEEALDSMLAMPADAFPGSHESLEIRAVEALNDVFARRGFPARLAAGLRHMALVMKLRGDSRANAVAAAAVHTAKRRPSTLTIAMASHELWLQLWTHAQLPTAYRHRVRAELRRLVKPKGAADWLDVQELDLAQAAAEGLARAIADEAPGPGLPPVPTLDFELARKLASHAKESFKTPALRRQARAGSIDGIAGAARRWLEHAPVPAAFELAQFAATVCFDSCPHRCFDKAPKTEPDDVFRGPCPSAPAGESPTTE